MYDSREPCPATAASAAVPGVHGQQVVHARARHQFAVAAQVGGRLDGVHHQVPAGDGAVRQPRGLLQEGDEVAVADVLAQAPHRLHVPLLVELEAVGVHRAVQVDGELRDAQQRPVDVDEAGRAVPQGQPPGQAQVAVEPGVEERPAVDLHGHLAPAVRPAVGARLDPQGGGVGVGADDPEGRVRLGPLGDVPGDDRAAAQHVLAACRAVPGVRLRDLPEARLLQPLGGVRHGVVRRGARREEGHQVVGVAAVEAGVRSWVHLNEREGPLPCAGAGPRGGPAGSSTGPVPVPYGSRTGLYGEVP